MLALGPFSGAPQKAFARSNRAPAAEPAPRDKSEELIARGLELRQAGKDQEALPLFQEAAQLRPGPKTKAQIGLCEFALGLWVDAETHMEEAMKDRTDPWIRRNEATLDKAVAGIRSKLGSLDVWGEPKGAQVAIDGKPVGTLPLARPLRLPVGRRSLSVEAAGFLTDNHMVDVSSENLSREHIALAPSPNLKARVAAADEGATVAVKQNDQKNEQPSSSSDDESSPFYKRWWFWTAAGVVVLGAAGATAWALTRNNCEAAMGASCARW